MASCSCSHWWHAPIYFTASICLAIIAITSFSIPSKTTDPTTTTFFPLNQTTFPTNATAALRHHGFTIMATLLQFSPQLFISASHSTTVFAIAGASLSTLLLPPYTMQIILQYHTVPLSLPLQELIKKHKNSCIPTLVPSKNLSLTKIDAVKHSIEINNVTVTHLDLFLDDFFTVHGVIHPFISLDHHNNSAKITPDFIKSSNCGEFLSSDNYAVNSTRNGYSAEWVQMVRSLSSSGFVSFAIGLNSILDRILHDNPDLGPVTVFAPLDFGYVGSTGWLLDRIVRYHIVSQRYTYSELTALSGKTLLSTLLSENAVEITTNFNVSHSLAVNGIDVVSPDIISSQMFIVHGISRALDFLNLAKS